MIPASIRDTIETALIESRETRGAMTNEQWGKWRKECDVALAYIQQDAPAAKDTRLWCAVCGDQLEDTSVCEVCFELQPREQDAPQPVAPDAADWVRLEDLPPGMIFTTQNGILAVKSEYYGSIRQCMCVLLESGEYAHFEDGNDTLVMALELQRRPATAPDSSEEMERG